MDFAIGWFGLFSAAGIIIAWFIGLEEYAGRHPLQDATRTFFAVLGVLVLVGNVISLSASFLATRMDNATEKNVAMSICSISKQMGLTSGKPYGAEVGARISGSYGDGYFYNSLFGGHGQIHIQPGSALSVGFDYQGKSAILELPLAQTTFVKDVKAVKPTIAIRLECGKTVWATQDFHLSPAHWRIDSGIVLLVQDVVERDPLVPTSTTIMTDGLAPIVSQNLGAVEIHLSPELYSKILG